MLISVKALTGRTLTLRVAATHSIALVKALVFRRAGFPIDQQRLIFGSRQLEDHRTLADYGIQEGAVLHLVLGLRGGMQIFVETLTGETVTLDVTASETVRMAKAKIQDKIGLPSSLQGLTFAGKRLADDDLLSAHGILAESKLRLTGPTRGGGRKEVDVKEQVTTLLTGRGFERPGHIYDRLKFFAGAGTVQSRMAAAFQAGGTEPWRALEKLLKSTKDPEHGGPSLWEKICKKSTGGPVGPKGEGMGTGGKGAGGGKSGGGGKGSGGKPSTAEGAEGKAPAPAADAKAVARSKATAEDWARIRLDTNEWTTSDAEVSVPVDQVDPFAMHQAMGQDKPHLGADAMDTSLEAEPALLTLAPSLEVAQELIDAAAASAPAPDGAPAAPVDDSPAALICPVPVRGGAVVVFRGAVRLAASASGGAEGVAEPAPQWERRVGYLVQLRAGANCATVCKVAGELPSLPKRDLQRVVVEVDRVWCSSILWGKTQTGCDTAQGALAFMHTLLPEITWFSCDDFGNKGPKLWRAEFLVPSCQITPELWNTSGLLHRGILVRPLLGDALDDAEATAASSMDVVWVPRSSKTDPALVYQAAVDLHERIPPALRGGLCRRDAGLGVRFLLARGSAEAEALRTSLLSDEAAPEASAPAIPSFSPAADEPSSFLGTGFPPGLEYEEVAGAFAGAGWGGVSASSPQRKGSHVSWRLSASSSPPLAHFSFGMEVVEVVAFASGPPLPQTSRGPTRPRPKVAARSDAGPMVVDVATPPARAPKRAREVGAQSASAAPLVPAPSGGHDLALQSVATMQDALDTHIASSGAEIERRVEAAVAQRTGEFASLSAVLATLADTQNQLAAQLTTQQTQIATQMANQDAFNRHVAAALDIPLPDAAPALALPTAGVPQP